MKYRAIYDLRDSRSSERGQFVYNFDAEDDDEACQIAKRYETDRQPSEALRLTPPLYYDFGGLLRIDQEEITTRLSLK
jgi:hypothetical protein